MASTKNYLGNRMRVSVFKSPKKADTYLYIETAPHFEAVPEVLLEQFGQPIPVMELLVTAEKKLARITGSELIEAINEKGFYLQLPPPDEEELPVIDNPKLPR